MHFSHVSNLDSVESPALLVDVDRVQTNIDRMISIVGGETARLRPHLKTHKMSNIVAMQVASGITQFKAATLTEAEMAASAGAKDVIVSHQLIGPKIPKLHQLASRYGDVSFAALVDDASVVVQTANACSSLAKPLRLFVDIDCGMHRTGIPLGKSCQELIDRIAETKDVQFAGLHVYDGHLHQRSLEQRRCAVLKIIDEVKRFLSDYPRCEVIAGGSPTFAIWAQETNWQCSPGTTIFWDVGYGTNYPDLNFDIAAVLLARVISKPGSDLVCLDTGYKAMAAEMPLQQRVVFPEIADAVPVNQSEEHLVIRTSHADQISVGDAFIAFPKHICPTVAKYAAAYIVRGGQATGEVWPITARTR
jgi:D-serine deaminase-like pyridoxal phosphate-dependent protein